LKTEIYTIFLFNAELNVFDNAVYRLSITLFHSEIFAVKLESCRKSHRFLNVFCPPKFKRNAASKSCIKARQVLKFRRATPPNSEVINVHLLHFKPVFDFFLKKL